MMAASQPGHEQRQPEAEQDHDSHGPQGVGPQAYAADDLGHAHDRDREGDRQAEDYAQRSAPPADPAGRQQCREHRQHARTQRGARPREQREAEENDHLNEKVGRETANDLQAPLRFGEPFFRGRLPSPSRADVDGGN
jgi:hypothetical protein